jgi:hypothetical protein
MSALGCGSSHHAATAPVDPFRLDAASVNDRFRLGADGLDSPPDDR